MKKILLAMNILLLVFLTSSCQTVVGTVEGAATGMQKDVTNTGAVLCATGKTISDALNKEDSQKPKGIIYKMDDWIKDHLW